MRNRWDVAPIPPKQIAKPDQEQGRGSRRRPLGQLQGLIAKDVDTRETEKSELLMQLIYHNSLYHVSGDVLNILYLLFIS